MSARIRKKPVTRRPAATIASSDASDFRIRFEAVADEIAVEIRNVANDLSDSVLHVIARSSDLDESLRDAVRLAVSCRVLQQFLAGLTDRMSSSDVRSSRSVPDVHKLLAELPIGNVGTGVIRRLRSAEP